MFWYQYSKTQVLLELKTDIEFGLKENEARTRLLQFGGNILPSTKTETWLGLFFRQFKSPLVYILLICALIVLFLGQIADGLIIFSVLLVNAVIGVLQEGKNSRVLESLKKLSEPEATVIRSGQEVIVPEQVLVPGDILILNEGQKVSADARIIFCHNFKLDESSLTGESGGVQKHEHALGQKDLPVTSQHNMVFMGTNVLSGNARAVVVATGVKTQLGSLSKVLQTKREHTPLQKNINQLSGWILYFIAIASFGLFVLGLSVGKSFVEMFSVVVSLAVSVIPEGLPLVITVILVTGAFRMSKKNALVKKLQAVEALGQASVLALDKTGTLTFNQMVVKKLTIGEKVFEITGDGYEPQGQARLQGKVEMHDLDLILSAKIACLASSAQAVYSEQNGNYKVSGDPTEAAITVFGEKFGFYKNQMQETYREVSETPFDYKNKYRSVVYAHEGENFFVVIGAPEVLLKNSTHFLSNNFHKPLSPEQNKNFEKSVDEFSSRGFRIVAFGFKKISKQHPLDSISDLVFGGIFAMEDALRPQAKEAVAMAHRAGVKVVMITGDLKTTALAIAKEAGIFSEGDSVLNGTEMQAFSEREFAEKIMSVSVFSRITPEDKMKIIQAYKKAGQVVAMSGDGVNDAASLLSADLGVAMGKSGTEVAKSAADIVLMDDNLFSIVSAIYEGRVMYQNIKKNLAFLFSTSMGEFLTVVMALFFKLPFPVLAVQILWMNLVTDPLLGAALASEKGEGDLIHQRAEKFEKYFIDQNMLWHIGIVATTMAVVTIYFFQSKYTQNLVYAQTFSLTLLATFQWFNSLNCRFIYKSIFHKRIFSNKYIWISLVVNLVLQLVAVYNPWLNSLLHTTPLSWLDWLVILGIAGLILPLEEFRKFCVRRFWFAKL